MEVHYMRGWRWLPLKDAQVGGGALKCNGGGVSVRHLAGVQSTAVISGPWRRMKGSLLIREMRNRTVCISQEGPAELGPVHSLFLSFQPGPTLLERSILPLVPFMLFQWEGKFLAMPFFHSKYLAPSLALIEVTAYNPWSLGPCADWDFG